MTVIVPRYQSKYMSFNRARCVLVCFQGTRLAAALVLTMDVILGMGRLHRVKNRHEGSEEEGKRERRRRGDVLSSRISGLAA